MKESFDQSPGGSRVSMLHSIAGDVQEGNRVDNSDGHRANSKLVQPNPIFGNLMSRFV